MTLSGSSQIAFWPHTLLGTTDSSLTCGHTKQELPTERKRAMSVQNTLYYPNTNTQIFFLPTPQITATNWNLKKYIYITGVQRGIKRKPSRQQRCGNWKRTELLAIFPSKFQPTVWSNYVSTLFISFRSWFNSGPAVALSVCLYLSLWIVLNQNLRLFSESSKKQKSNSEPPIARNYGLIASLSG